MSVPYTDSEASEARQWSNRYGPPNAWTASFGTAARMIGRLLDERERLMAKQTVAAPGDDYIREWHDEFQRWKAVADAKQELRDQFAAAALNGLLARRDCYDHEIAVLAWDMADAMLRERCRSGGDCPLPDNAPNHDAAPAATASEATASPERVCVRSDAGTGDTQSFDAYAMFAGSVMNWISEATSAADWSSDGGRKIMAQACSRCWDAFDRIAYPTDHGASPEARAESDEDRTDKAATSHRRDGTGDTPVAEPMPQEKQAEVSDRSKPITGPDPDLRVWGTHTHAAHATQGEGSEQREGTEPVAWAVMTADGTAALHMSCTKQGSIGWKRMMERQGEVVPLYRQAPNFAPPPPDNAAKAPDNAEPVAWAVACDYGDYAVALFSDEASARTEADRRALVGLRSGYVVSPLYRHPPCQDFSQKNLTLTDAEREAVAWAEDCADSQREWKIGATLRGLLERLG